MMAWFYSFVHPIPSVKSQWLGQYKTGPNIEFQALGVDESRDLDEDTIMNLDVDLHV